MLTINTNLSSLIAQSSMKQSTNKLNKAIERMTTGFKINHASDNAANYSISTNMTTKINSYMVAEDNAAMGLDMTTAISENLDLINQHASRIRDLCEQASNGTYGEESLKAIQAEIESRMTEIERIKANAEFNGIKLFEAETDGTQEMRVTGSFIEEVTQLTEEEAIAQGYTIIKTADELQAMQDNLSGKYILMNDIDLEGYDWIPVAKDASNGFKGDLNGNGFVIKNLTINKPTEDNIGLFGGIYYSNTGNIENLGLENVDIIGQNNVGGLWGTGPYINVSNCYVTGTITGNNGVGGFFGQSEGANFTNCYSKVEVTGNSQVGVLGGNANYSQTTTTVYYTNDLSTAPSFGDGTYGAIEVSSAELNALIIPPTIIDSNIEVTLQVGINSNQNSQITMQLIALETLTSIDASSSSTARNSLSLLDNFIANISKSQTEIGAVQNRLESVLEEITIQRDNLISSRSTIRDADIADESSRYIQQQILQQASATLLATANQSPSIALQLI